MCKDLLGDGTHAPKRKETELEVMICTIEEGEELDPTRNQPARTLTWFVTEVLCRSRTSINVLQVVLAYLAGAKPEIHKELRAAADRQAELAMQIAGLPQHVRNALPNMDWLGSEFAPSPLINPRRTFLASLVLASMFLLDKAFLNKAWAKLSGLEALEVGKCKRALSMALNWRLWASRKVAPQPSPALFDQPPVQPQLVHSLPTYPSTIQPGAWDKSLAHVVAQQDSPARSISPHSHSSVFATSSTPTLYSADPVLPSVGCFGPLPLGRLRRCLSSPCLVHCTRSATHLISPRPWSCSFAASLAPALYFDSELGLTLSPRSSPVRSPAPAPQPVSRGHPSCQQRHRMRALVQTLHGIPKQVAHGSGGDMFSDPDFVIGPSPGTLSVKSLTAWPRFVCAH